MPAALVFNDREGREHVASLDHHDVAMILDGLDILQPATPNAAERALRLVNLFWHLKEGTA